MIPRFRAWIKKQKAIVETSDIVSIDFEDEMVEIQNVYFVDGLPDSRDLETYRFDEIKLMQSTGLYDKGGTEVFEGDILHHQIQTEYTFIVKYDKDKGRWYGDGLSRTYRIDIAKRFLPYYYKVIGNIYENPELLEVENGE